ncbi:uncharacterized protein LOC129950401 [Eupeodes corollae]|uniref:uncharacterized protein LOC129950401 n=1 Tax=Eupeodes corollae TaxID=290404 RepID=UPI002491431B|nr:uncharacterized protein LOC129950401 [Eupeodes corollae]
MNIVKQKRGRAKGTITRVSTFSESVVDSTPIDMLEIQLKKLQEAWSEFVLQQNNLYEFYDQEGFVDPEPEYGEYETKYFEAFSKLSGSIRKHPDKDRDEASTINASVLQKSNSRQSVVLPKLVIPVFTGDYKDWPVFKDLFTGTIDCNVSLTGTQKFQYLKSFLGGEAATLLKHISFTEENYLEAWDKLEARYDKKHLIVQSFIKSFMALPSSNNLNLETLRKLTNGADEIVRGLNALQMNSRDPWLIYILVQKLDSETKQAWAKKVESRDDCTIQEFLLFLQNQCVCLESCSSFSGPIKTLNKVSNNIRTHFVEAKPNCPKCKEDHILPFCKTFLALDTTARREFVKQNSIFFNCLRVGHASNKCNSKFRCRSCNARHHTLVHEPRTTSTNKTTEQPSTQNPSNSAVTHHSLESTRNTHSSLESNAIKSTILPTAVVKVQDKFGSFQNIRILLDSGSQISFITEKALQRLGLPRKPSRIPIVGVASTSAGKPNGLISLKLHSRFNSNHIDIDCHVIKKLTSMLPPLSLNLNTTQFLSLDLADPKFYEPGTIDMLIGADNIFNIILETPRAEPGAPNSLLTIFGWVIAGSYDRTPSSEAFSLIMPKQRAEDDFIQTHSRHTDGRYMVNLPFKPNCKPTSESSSRIALNRLYSMEKRFVRDPELQKQYSSFLNEYISLGHMEEIPVKEINDSDSYYLPHHAVFKADSSTTKVRVVFDGSAKSSPDSRSLNESLFVGPEVQCDIFTICLRSRRHVYTMSGDIEKMYRQIWISPKHTNYQRILWRENPESPIKHYRLLTVTYGTSAASFLAKRALKQLALDSAETHPRASSVILNDFYVDDLVTGADTIEDLIALQKELVEVLSLAGFNLRKWTTNCWPLLISFPEDQRELSPIDFENSLTVKVLGLRWCPSGDCFSYKVNLDQSTSCTKRSILSEASRIFDPLGFLAPVVVAVKIFFQDLWRAGVGWDDQILQELSHRWITIREELHLLESIRIPRLMWTNKVNYEFHAFCDASLDAYAAVIYCRSENLDGTVSISLIAAKTKVAPIKVLSLPRLELCGTLLLTRLVKKIKISLQIKHMQLFAWTDSSIVLHWLAAPPKKWSVFVGNRTSEIVSSIPVKSWNHVRSADNPADVPSRGIPPSQLESTDIWWNGPVWLKMNRSEWPKTQHDLQNVSSDQLEERNSNKVQVFVSQINENNILRQIINKSSDWIKSLRVVAYIFRYLKNRRLAPELRDLHALSTSELNIAKTCLIKASQYILFAAEIESLNKNKYLPSRSKLSSIAPFLDSENVLRAAEILSER